MNPCASCSELTVGRLCVLCAGRGLAPLTPCVRPTVLPTAAPLAHPPASRPPVPGTVRAVRSGTPAPGGDGVLTGAWVVAIRAAASAGGDAVRLAGALVLALLVLLVLLTPSLRAAALLAAAVWLLGRAGLSDLLLPLELVLLGRRRRAPSATVPSLAFRLAGAGGITAVHLQGHDTGVQLGDQVEGRGPRMRRATHVWRVVNRTTGQVLCQPGLISMVALGALDPLLFMAVLAQLGGRG